MLKKVLLATALSAVLTMGSVNSAMADTKVGVINLPLIMETIPQYKTMQETLAKEFGPREQELQKLNAQGTALAQEIQGGTLKGDALVQKQREFEQLQSEFQLKARAFQEDQRKRVNEEQRKLAVLVQKGIDSIAMERGIDLVLRGEAIAYTIDALDLSKAVIDRVSKSK